ncbi:diguanylate cyclase [Parasphingorhabdus sp.]|uniref:GGDEF domain-containing protein n=1 Tax=Parasphingorhabdus sp. TaxID=2709688 RepID=UPI0032655F26
MKATGCAVPAAIHDDLTLMQHDRIGALIPVLYFTIATIAIVASAASGGGFDPIYHLILPSGFIAMGAYRCLVWYRRKGLPGDLVKARRHLKSTTLIAWGLGLIGALWTLDAFYATIEARRVLAPIFIFMLTFSAGICLSSLPRAAIGLMVTALFAPTVAMILSTDAGIRAMGISLMIVSWLMTGFIIHNFAQTVSSLKLRRKLQTLAESDALTGLANRRAFDAKFEEMAAACQSDDQIVLTMIDLDGFKYANDQHGHPAGDAILIEVAKRLQKTCVGAPCIARLGGDEFAILSNSRGDAAFHQKQKEAIRAVIRLPHLWESRQIMVSASLGIATYPENGQSLSELLKCSDQALYAEKSKRQRAG